MSKGKHPGKRPGAAPRNRRPSGGRAGKSPKPRGDFSTTPPRNAAKASGRASGPASGLASGHPPGRLPSPAPSGRLPEQSHGQTGDKTRSRPRGSQAGRYWLCGQHATRSALVNPARRVDRLLGTAEGLATLMDRLGKLPEGRPPPETVERSRLEGMVPPGSVHQGVAVLVAPLLAQGIDEMLFRLPAGAACAIILDQVTDPRNVGAVLRAAAAFEASFVAITERNAPEESAALAKAASGALDAVPLVRVVNLARAIGALKEEGFVCVGLDSEAAEPISRLDLTGRIAFVFGAEGRGLRRLTRERCDQLARIPQGQTVESLNVASAAAVALYERTRQRSH